MTAPSTPVSEATKNIVLQGIIQQSIKTILLYESGWYSCITRSKEPFSISKAFMVHVLVFILTWIIPSLILSNCYLYLGVFFNFVFLCTFALGSTLIYCSTETHMLAIIFSLLCVSSLLWINSYDLCHESQANQICVHGNITRILEMFVINPTCSVCLDS